MKRGNLILLVALVIVSLSCSKNDAESDLIFNLSFVYGSGDEDFIQARYSSDLTTEFPKIIINGVLMDYMYISQGIVGLLDVYPYSETVNYSISVNGRSLSGSIKMPVISEVMCNNV